MILGTPVTDVAIWIPARRASSRLTAKLLQDVAGAPLLTHTINAAKRAANLTGSNLAVVTDCPEIEALALSTGTSAIIVEAPCRNGTERLARALLSLPLEARPTTIVNLQGDEPLVPPHAIAELISRARDCNSRLATMMLPGRSASRSVSVVTDRRGRALYFSRAPIPGLHPTVDPTDLSDATPHWGSHVGLYLYSADVLAGWLQMAPSPLEVTEGLEQLRALHHGLPIDVFGWQGIDATDRNGHDHPWFAVDTAADLERLQAALRGGARYADTTSR